MGSRALNYMNSGTVLDAVLALQNFSRGEEISVKPVEDVALFIDPRCYSHFNPTEVMFWSHVMTDVQGVEPSYVSDVSDFLKGMWSGLINFAVFRLPPDIPATTTFLLRWHSQLLAEHDRVIFMPRRRFG